MLSLFFGVAAVVAAQESGVFGFGPASAGLLLKLDVGHGNATTLSTDPANNTFFAFEAARIHPTFKYWYQVFQDASHRAMTIEGREIFPGARVTSSTLVPHPSVCAKGATNWTFFDLQCGGRPVFVLGALVGSQLSLTLLEVNGTLKCLPPVSLGSSPPVGWLQSGLDLDSLLALSLDDALLMINITDDKHPSVVARTVYPSGVSLARLHYFFRPNAWFGFYFSAGGTGLAAVDADSYKLTLFPTIKGYSLPSSSSSSSSSASSSSSPSSSPFLSTLDTDNNRMVGVLAGSGGLQFVAVDVSSGKLIGSAPCKESLVSLNSLANVFASP